MNQKEKRYRVGLFGHYGNKNLGDEAIILAAIQNLRERIAEVELIGLSINPEDTSERYNLKTFAIRYKGSNLKSDQKNKKSASVKSESWYLGIDIKKVVVGKVNKLPALTGFLSLLKNIRSEIRFLIQVRHVLKSLDVIIICGSNQFLDNFGGPWGFPFTLMKWGILAKSTGTKVLFMSVGAGPLTHPLSYWMLKKVLFRADYLSYRDNGSRRLIENKIPDLKGLVYPDIAHSLKTIPSVKSTQVIQMGSISINPMPVFDGRYWYMSRPDKYEAYVDHLAKFISYLVNQGFTVNLFNNHPSDIYVMDDLLLRIQKLPDINFNNIHSIHNETVEDLINTISEANIVVATRFHSTVLPLRLGKPVLGICYHSKSKELLKDVGLGDYYVDIHEFTSEDLSMKFDSLFKNIENAKIDVESHYNRYRKLMDEQWKRVADLIANNNNSLTIVRSSSVASKEFLT